MNDEKLIIANDLKSTLDFVNSILTDANYKIDYTQIQVVKSVEGANHKTIYSLINWNHNILKIFSNFTTHSNNFYIIKVNEIIATHLKTAFINIKQDLQQAKLELEQEYKNL